MWTPVFLSAVEIQTVYEERESAWKGAGKPCTEKSWSPRLRTLDRLFTWPLPPSLTCTLLAVLTQSSFVICPLSYINLDAFSSNPCSLMTMPELWSQKYFWNWKTLYKISPSQFLPILPTSAPTQFYVLSPFLLKTKPRNTSKWNTQHKNENQEEHAKDQ